MSYSVSGTTITMTRGDTFRAQVSIKNPDGEEYIPTEGDCVRFAMKETWDDARPLLVKEIPIESMTLILKPEDTKDFAFGNYVYDIQLTKSTGEVDTFIAKAKIKLTEEVC